MSRQLHRSVTQIRVTIDLGYVNVSPDPAEVIEGGDVEWQFEVQPTLPNLTLEIYFSHQSPTTWSTQQINTQPSIGGVTPTITARVNDPGEYKYGVKATELGTRQVIADDDPYLIVRPK
jgi:hypothetical protein